MTGKSALKKRDMFHLPFEEVDISHSNRNLKALSGIQKQHKLKRKRKHLLALQLFTYFY